MPEPSFDEDAWRDRLAAFREEKESRLLSGPDAPVGEVADGPDELSWYPLDPTYRVVARFQPVQTPESVTLSTTAGPDREYERVATFGVPLGGDHHVLTGYRAEGQATIFVPFTDETTGGETTAAGRYLDVDPGSAGTGDDVVLDFNLAQLPFAAYSDRYASTVPPSKNHLPVAVRAGEQATE